MVCAADLPNVVVEVEAVASQESSRPARKEQTLFCRRQFARRGRKEMRRRRSDPETMPRSAS